MATAINFNGQLVELPGAYSAIKSGINNSPANLPYGNILILDIDAFNTFGGGAGITGQASGDNPKSAIYKFDNVKSFRQFVRGGQHWDIAGPLFKPFGTNQGVSNITYVRAMTTTPASQRKEFKDGGNGGTLSIKTKHEGLAGNGFFGNESLAFGKLQILGLGPAGEYMDIDVNGQVIAQVSIVSGMVETDFVELVVKTINENSYPQAPFTAGINPADASEIIIYAPPGTSSAMNTWTVGVGGTWSGLESATNFAGGSKSGVDFLSRGFGWTVEKSTSDVTKYIMKFYRGTFTGLDNDQNNFYEQPTPYNGIQEFATTHELLATSPEFNTHQEIVDWMVSDFSFNNHFWIDLGDSPIEGNGTFNDTGLASILDTLLPFTGGHQHIASNDLAIALEALEEEDYTFVLAPQPNDFSLGATNLAILSHLESNARFEKFMVVAGGDSKSVFTNTCSKAASFNSEKVILVHGAVEVNDPSSGTGRRSKKSMYKAACVLGRMAGLQPQTPITFKGLNYVAEKHDLSKVEKALALKKGVLVTFFDSDIGAFTVLQGVNTLQNNRNLINADGTSHSVQLRRITSQLNKEIEVNAKRDLLGNQQQGPNRNTISPEVVTDWLTSFLQRKTATSTVDNLILSFKDISVTIVQDAYQIDYAIVPNFEVNKLFFTGLIIDPNS